MKRIFIHEMENTSRKEIGRTGNRLTITWLVLDDEMDSETNEYASSEECDLAFEEAVSDFLEEGYIEKNQKSKKQMLQDIEKSGKFEIANRFCDFILKNEKDNYTNFSTLTDGIKGWQPGGLLELIFLDPVLDLFEEMDLDSVIVKLGYIPLARIRDKCDFFAIKVDVPECPVFYRDHEIGEFALYSDSLDVFLDRLKKNEE